jgi:signal transduction histidine kinase
MSASTTTMLRDTPMVRLARAALGTDRAVLLPRAAQETGRLLGASSCEIWLAENGLPQVAAVYLKPGAVVGSLDAAALTAALRGHSDSLVQVDDWLCVPVPGDPNPRGVLALYRARHWTDDELATAALAATIVALALKLAEARSFDDRERDQFLALIGHDLRSPLSNVRVGAQLARRNLQAGDVDSVRQALEIIEHQSARLLDRLQVLLEAVAAAGKWLVRLEALDMGAIAESVVAPYRLAAEQGGTGTTFEVAVDPRAPRARGDASQIAQALEQLVDNAAKYAAGGRVSITVTGTGTVVRTEVCDNGPGIRPEDLDRIFAPFARGRAAAGKEGYGLGLYLARNIVTAQGGQLGVSRTSRSGTCMSLTLPVARADEA